MCDVVDIYGFTVDPGYADWLVIKCQYSTNTCQGLLSMAWYFSLTNPSLLLLCRTRYFSAPRRGHNPLQGRAYYQLLECLGVSLLTSSLRLTVTTVRPVPGVFMDQSNNKTVTIRSLQILKIHSPMREKSKQNCSVIPSREALSAARVAAFQLKRIRQSDEPGPFSACGVWAAATKTEPFTGTLLSTATFYSTSCLQEVSDKRWPSISEHATCELKKATKNYFCACRCIRYEHHQKNLQLQEVGAASHY